MRVSALTLLLAAALLAGCGGGGGGGGSTGNGGGTTSSSSNGEASKSAVQVLADATKAATTASSFHVSGTATSGGTPLTLDLTIAGGKGAKGTISTGGASFDLVEIGKTLYIHGSDAFWKKFAGAAVAQLLHGKWLKGSATSGQLASLASMTSAEALFKQVTANHGKLANKGETTYAGQQVVEITKVSNGDALYVAATGTPYPVALVSAKKSQGAVTFDRWNESVSISAPSGAIDISSLGG